MAAEQDVLYHYTSKYHLPKILKTGYLKLTESNLKAPTSYEDALPKPDDQLYKPVVWLTRSDAPQGNGLEGSPTNKYEIKITVVKRPHYDPWLIWSRKNRIKSSWAKRLESGRNPNSWYVSEQIIPLNTDELVRIENTVTGEVMIDTATENRSCKLKVIKPAGCPNKAFDIFLSDSNLKRNDTLVFSI